VSLEVVRHGSARALLERAGPWLLEAEDLNNLILSLTYLHAERERAEGEGASAEADRAGTAPDATAQTPYFASVERGGEVLGCALRSPPHQLLLTDMPIEAVDATARSVARACPTIPAVLGIPELALTFAGAWTELTGVTARPGTEQRLYRLDAVTPLPAPGRLRRARLEDAPLVRGWADAFARDVHMRFGPGEERVAGWVEQRSLYIWEDGAEPVSMAVAHGVTPNGIRIGYVYTPPERRRRGYAGACVADLSQRLLDEGRAFCVLYADLSNTTTNALYQRMGYRPIQDVRDYYFDTGATA